MSQKTLNLCLERYNFVKFGETTKSSHTVLCINNAYSVNSDKYRLTPTAIASKHGDGYVFTLNYDFDRPLFTIVQKSYSLDGTSGNIVFEGIDPVSKGGSKYLRKVTVSPVKLSDGSYLLEVTNDEYLRIGTTGAALGDEDLESLNEKIVATGGIEKSVENVGGKQVLRLDAGGPSGAKEIVYFDIDPSDPPSGIYAAITEALSKNKLPAIKIDDALYLYTATGTDKYVFVGGFTKESVGYTEIEVSDTDSVTSKSVDDKVYNMYILSQDDPASPGETPSDEDQWVCDADKHVITKDELVAAHTDCRYFILNNAVEPDSNSRKYFASVTVISNSYIRLRFYMMQYDAQGVAEFYQKTVADDSEGRLYILSSYSATLAGTMQAVLVSEPQSFDSTQKAQGRDNIGAASASDVAALQSQVSSLSDVSAYSVKGEATVAQLNAGPSGIQAGWAYQLTDSGTLTDGSLAVVAGDTVAWDGTKWFPLVKSDYYATKTYAQNVAHSIAPEFDATRTSENPYKAGESVTYINGQVYTFNVNHYGAWDFSVVRKADDVFTKEKNTELALSDVTDKKVVSFNVSLNQNKFISSSGNITNYTDSNYRVSNYIDVFEKELVKVKCSSNFTNLACVFYAADYSVVQIALKSTSNSSTITYYEDEELVVPSGAKYMLVASVGSPLATAEYIDEYVLKNQADSDYSKEVVTDIAEKKFIDFDFEKISGKFVSSSGTITDASDSNFRITDYIDVSGKTLVKVSCCSNYYNASCVFYAADYSVVKVALISRSGTSTITNFSEVEVPVPASASYMVLAEVNSLVIAAQYFEKYETKNQPQINLNTIKISDITEQQFVDFPITYQQNKFISSSGAVVNYNDDHYYITDYIDVSGKTLVKISGSAGYGNAVCVFYATDYSVVQVALWDTQGGSGWRDFDNVELVVPSGAKYMLVAGTNQGGRALPKASFFSKYIVNKIWNGKKWCCVGDSLTERNIRTTKNYADYVSEETGIAIYNMGVGGSGYKRRYDENLAFYQRVANVPLDSDVVTIFGSGNDLLYASDMGSATDTGTETIAGCINTTIDNLYARLPAVHLGIVSPTPWDTSRPANPNNNMTKYAELLRQICYNRSIPFLDLYHCSNLRPWDSDFLPIAYSKDNGAGTHPDETGHKLIAGRFKVFVESIL